MNSLLLSMPGSPIIYYGDEIGMGDNFYLGDRNGVRTPMQWSPDRNAGFSRADPQQLYLPPIMDPIYGYEAVNVEAQTRDRSSLLNWMRRMLAVRKTSQAFGRGTLRFIRPGNRKVLVYLREYGEDIDPLRREPRALGAAGGARPRRSQRHGSDRAARPHALPAGGGAALPAHAAGYGFYWFRLSREGDRRRPGTTSACRARTCRCWCWLTAGTASSPSKVAVVARRPGAAPARAARGAHGAAVHRRAALVRGQGRAHHSARLLDHTDRQDPLPRWFARHLRRRTAEGTSQRYFVPLAIAFEDIEEARWRRLQPAAIARVRQQATVGVARRRLRATRASARAIVDAIGASAELPTQYGRVRFTPTALTRSCAAIPPRT